MKEVTEVKFAKVHPSAIIPSKRDEDMGFDIYACFDEDYIVIGQHQTKLIPTGIASACNPKYGFLLRERGSTGSKGIALRCGVIDSGYRNEWFVGLTNTTGDVLYISKLPIEEVIERECIRIVEQSKDKYNLNLSYDEVKKDLELYARVYPYSKAIAQALVVPVPKVKADEIPYDELKEIKSERGMGALGSSNK